MIIDSIIVILNYVNFQLTINCVNNLLSLNISDHIIIVDNCSPNDSFIKLQNEFKNKNIDIIKTNCNSGYSSGNNYGVNFAINKYPCIKYISIMNPDVIIEYSNIFKNLKYKLNENNDVAAITGLMKIRGQIKINNCFWKIPSSLKLVLKSSIFAEMDNNIIHNTKNKINKVEVLPGSFFMIKREIFEKINGFDENVFLFNEETILAIKIKSLNMINAISINDYYNHNHIKENTSLINKLKNNYISSKSNIYLCKEYYNKKNILLLYFVEASNYLFITLRFVKQKIKKLFFRK